VSHEDFPNPITLDIVAILHAMEARIDERLSKIERHVHATDETARLILGHVQLTGRQVEQIMSQIDDLQAAVAAVQSDVQTTAETIGRVADTVTLTAEDVRAAILLIQNLSAYNPEVADAIAKLQGVHGTLVNSGAQLSGAADTLSASDTALDAAVQTPPPPGPSVGAASLQRRAEPANPALNPEATETKDGNPIDHAPTGGGPSAAAVDDHAKG
jgi:uncharacterized phage infection (PIP) family protein YhgE